MGLLLFECWRVSRHVASAFVPCMGVVVLALGAR
jgi:hypothetical protein